MPIERDDPFGGAWGAALGVRAGDFVFTTVAAVQSLDDRGEPRFPATFDEQIRVVGEHLATRLARLGCGAADVVDATVWLHPSVDIAPAQLLEALQIHVFHDVMPAMSFLRSDVLYPDALISVKVVAYAPIDR